MKRKSPRQGLFLYACVLLLAGVCSTVGIAEEDKNENQNLFQQPDQNGRWNC